MAETDDEKIDSIICNRVEDRPVPLVENSMKEHCSECGSEVWISPKTLEVKKETGAKIICIRCILPKLDVKSQFTMALGQLSEISEHNRKEIQKN